MPPQTHLIGLISDTHGLLRPEAIKELEGVEMILHAGDIDTPEILDALKQLAPVVAVRGNVDRGGWTKQLRTTEVVEVGQVSIYMIHSLEDMFINPRTAGFRVIVSGHSHFPEIAETNGILYVNPGSAGHRRFNSPVSLARLTIRGDEVDAEIIKLNV
jgi:putative phosphoesterase